MDGTTSIDTSAPQSSDHEPTFQAAQDTRRFAICDPWEGLIEGRYRISNEAIRLETVLLNVIPRAQAIPLTSRERELLSDWVTHGSQKSLSFKLDLSPSSISAHLARVLRKIGWYGRAPRLPWSIVRLAHAHRRVAFLTGDPTNGVPQRLRVRFVGSSWMSGLGLTSAEREVTELSLKGHGNSEIARLRGTSLRTVANQFARIFEKFGVSGRMEYVILLARRLAPQPLANAS